MSHLSNRLNDFQAQDTRSMTMPQLLCDIELRLAGMANILREHIIRSDRLFELHNIKLDTAVGQLVRAQATIDSLRQRALKAQSPIDPDSRPPQLDAEEEFLAKELSGIDHCDPLPSPEL